jgi:DNA replication protein DnaC
MTVQLDDAFLDDLGLGNASPEKKEAFKQQIVETLELRLGARLTENLSDEEIDEFDNAMKQSHDSEGAAEAWIKAHNPDYEVIVESELLQLKNELQVNMIAILGK